jgi:hypothetical protein
MFAVLAIYFDDDIIENILCLDVLKTKELANQYIEKLHKNFQEREGLPYRPWIVEISRWKVSE